MGTFYNPRIVTDGLVLSLDARNTKSYPGYGTVLSDLSNPTTTAATYGSPTFSNGVFSFDGSSQSIRAARSDINGGAWAYNQATVCVWVRMSSTATTEGNLATSEGCWEFKFVNQGDGTTKISWASNPWVWSTLSTAVPNDAWCMITFRHGVSLGQIWYNGTKIQSSAVSGTVPACSYRAAGASWPYVEFMSRGAAAICFAKGDFASAYLYGREITDSEIVQNFNALRGRFGI